MSLADRMVFVVGAPRSGTTWLQRMLSVHPDVVDLPSETHLFSSGISVLRDRTQGGHVGSTATDTWFMTDAEFAAAARAFVDAAYGAWLARTRPDAARVVERSPTHVWHLGLLGAVYPEAHVVHIVRDGRDVVRSQVAQTWGASDIGLAAAQWASAVRAARAAAPALRHYHEVRYEELLLRPSGIRDVFDALGLPVSDAVLQQAVLEGGLEVNVDPTRPDVASQKWRLEWGPDEVEAFEDAAGDVLDLLGLERLPSLAASRTAEPAARPRRRLREALPARPSRPAVFRPVPERMQDAVAALTAALAGPDRSALSALLDAPAVVIEHTAGGRAWRLVGPAAVDRLTEELAAEGPWGDPLRGEQQIGGWTWTLLLAHRAPDGAAVDRVATVTLDSDASITELRLFRLPYEAPTS